MAWTSSIQLQVKLWTYAHKSGATTSFDQGIQFTFRNETGQRCQIACPVHFTGENRAKIESTIIYMYIYIYTHIVIGHAGNGSPPPAAPSCALRLFPCQGPQVSVVAQRGG